MDELIFQEFKAPETWKWCSTEKNQRSKDLSGHDIFLSERAARTIVAPWELEKSILIRRGLAGHKPEEAIPATVMFVKKIPDQPRRCSKAFRAGSVRRRYRSRRVLGDGSQFAVRTRKVSKKLR